jgi:hypothetical protein
MQSDFTTNQRQFFSVADFFSVAEFFFQENGGKWKMVTSTSMKSIELNFELGVEFEETTADGRQVTLFSHSVLGQGNLSQMSLIFFLENFY